MGEDNVLYEDGWGHGDWGDGDDGALVGWEGGLFVVTLLFPGKEGRERDFNCMK